VLFVPLCLSHPARRLVSLQQDTSFVETGIAVFWNNKNCTVSSFEGAMLLDGVHLLPPPPPPTVSLLRFFSEIEPVCCFCLHNIDGEKRATK
jgi:hypothetical protein